MSTLSINDDPGRGLKYLGCFLIVLGTALFVYWKSGKISNPIQPPDEKT
jgi:hypothetical protein